MKINKAFLIITAVFIALSVFLPIFPSGGESFIEAAAASANAVNYEKSLPECLSDSAIVLDCESLSVLYSKNADEKRGMASTTKIMTALIAIESGDVDREFNIPKEAVGIEGSSVYLKESEPLTLRELLYCLMLESGNDAATAIAVCCAGSVDAFAEQMNSRALELGLKNTHFTNPHGLSDDNHYTTARELAIITAEAMKYPLFREIVSTKTKKVRYDGTENGRTLSNHNKLLFGYEGAIGVKTGYTIRDGKCLVSAAERDGLTIIAVTLHDPSPTATHKTLLDKAFGEYEWVEAAAEGEITADIPIQNGESGFITAKNVSPVELCLPKSAEIEIELLLPEALSAPIEEGQIIARARVLCGGKEVYIIYLEATQTIKEKKLTLLKKIFGE